jgi:hypothetical protein
MSLETDNREPSRYPNGEGCHAPLSNSCAAAQHLGGVSEGDRTGRADRVSRENSSGASETQPVAQGGKPTESAKAAGVVGVLRSSVDPSESKTDGERRRGTWVRVKGHGNGTGDGRGNLDKNSNKVSGAARFTVTVGASPTVEAPSESRMRENRPSGLMRGGVRRSLALCIFNPSAPPTLLLSVLAATCAPHRQGFPPARPTCRNRPFPRTGFEVGRRTHSGEGAQYYRAQFLLRFHVIRLEVNSRQQILRG